MTREELLWDLMDLFTKRGEISLNSYSVRVSPKPVISQTPWYDLGEKISVSKALQSLL